MTPKEKAKAKAKAEELVKEFSKFVKQESYEKKNYNAIECALIAVDELIKYSMPSSEFGGYVQSYTIEYWQEVKQEIEKL